MSNLLPKEKIQDPFNAGQMVGMLVMLVFLENNKDATESMLDKVKTVTAENLQEYFNKPAEDIYLMIDQIVKEIK